MGVTQLLILHKEHGLNLEEISLVLSLPEWQVREALRGRLKPTKQKRSFKKSKYRRPRKPK